ncbi:CBS domain-containing protein, partial [Mesorhizobium sp. M2C.T.Ca.TU.009.01.2.1]
YPDEYLEALSDKLLTANVSHLPVVSREEERLIGYIGWKDMMRVRSKKQAEERDRAALLSFGVKREPQQSVSDPA